MQFFKVKVALEISTIEDTSQRDAFINADFVRLEASTRLAGRGNLRLVDMRVFP